MVFGAMVPTKMLPSYGEIFNFVEGHVVGASFKGHGQWERQRERKFQQQ